MTTYGEPIKHVKKPGHTNFQKFLGLTKFILLRSIRDEVMKHACCIYYLYTSLLALLIN